MQPVTLIINPRVYSNRIPFFACVATVLSSARGGGVSILPFPTRVRPARAFRQEWRIGSPLFSLPRAPIATSLARSLARPLPPSLPFLARLLVSKTDIRACNWRPSAASRSVGWTDDTTAILTDVCLCWRNPTRGTRSQTPRLHGQSKSTGPRLELFWKRLLIVRVN